MQNTLKHKYMSRWEIVLNMKINEGKWEKKKKKTFILYYWGYNLMKTQF